LDLNETILNLLSTEEFSTKKPIYEQYDSTVQTNTILKPGSDAALIRIKETGKGVAATIDVNPRYVYINPNIGTQLSVLEAYRNLCCLGAKPIALTDCLNFGNPENPEIMWQFEESIEGLKKACETLDVPVVSGNVSFYNETNSKNIYPTPSIGMVAITDNPMKAPYGFFTRIGSSIIMIGEIKEGELGGSAYLKRRFGKVEGKLPRVNYEHHIKLGKFMREAVRNNLLLAAHDVAEGGIAICLCEMCIEKRIGAEVEFRIQGRKDFYLFSETQGVLILETDKAEVVLELARKFGISAREIGKTIQEKLKINDFISIDIERLVKASEKVLGNVFDWREECV